MTLRRKFILLVVSSEVLSQGMLSCHSSHFCRVELNSIKCSRNATVDSYVEVNVIKIEYPTKTAKAFRFVLDSTWQKCKV